MKLAKKHENILNEAISLMQKEGVEITRDNIRKWTIGKVIGRQSAIGERLGCIIHPIITIFCEKYNIK